MRKFIIENISKKQYKNVLKKLESEGFRIQFLHKTSLPLQVDGYCVVPECCRTSLPRISADEYLNENKCPTCGHKVKSDKQIIEQCLKYCFHRISSHPESGISKAVRKKEIERVLENL